VSAKPPMEHHMLAHCHDVCILIAQRIRQAAIAAAFDVGIVVVGENVRRPTAIPCDLDRTPAAKGRKRAVLVQRRFGVA